MDKEGRGKNKEEREDGKKKGRVGKQNREERKGGRAEHRRKIGWESRRTKKRERRGEERRGGERGKEKASAELANSSAGLMNVCMSLMKTANFNLVLRRDMPSLP